jgi:hypothetical protein
MTPEEIEEKVFNSVIDFLKHVTTLSSGSILLLATFLEKLFHKPHLGFLVAISFVCFAVSIIGAFAEFFLLVGSEKPSGPELYIGPLGFCLSYGCRRWIYHWDVIAGYFRNRQLSLAVKS